MTRELVSAFESLCESLPDAVSSRRHKDISAIAEALALYSESTLRTVRPRITFMFDNHTFQPIDISERAKARDQIKACFAEDGSGSAFMRWGEADGERPQDGARPLGYHLPGHMFDQGRGWGVTDEELDDFLDRFYAIEPRPLCRRKKR